MVIVEEGAAGGLIGCPIRALRPSQTPGAIPNLLSARKSPMVAETTPREDLHYRIRWQTSLLNWNDFECWADLPAWVTPVLEDALELRSWPFQWGDFEYRVLPEPSVVNLVTGAVRRLQRVAVLHP